MERARRAAVAALAPLVLLGSSVLALAASVGPAPLPAAAVAWPTSTLVISEVMTGGASASDEFVEIANQGASAVDLAGLEVAYVTSTGGTVTRKASWALPTVLEPGRRLLVANYGPSVGMTFADQPDLVRLLDADLTLLLTTSERQFGGDGGTCGIVTVDGERRIEMPARSAAIFSVSGQDASGKQGI